MALPNASSTLPTLILPPGVTLDNTIGALQIGVLVSVCLFGFVCLQVWQYSQESENDPAYFKLAVYSVWIFELVHTILICHTLYRVVITGFGTTGLPKFLFDCPSSLKVSVLFSGLVNAIVLTFFAYRIRKISSRWEIPILAWVLTLLRLAFVIADCALVLTRTLLQFSEDFGYMLTITLSIGAALDLFVAIALTYYLNKNRSGVETTDKLLTTLILMSIETGLVTSIVEVGLVLTFELMKHNFIWMAFLVIVAKTYSNSLMVSLNTRRNLRNKFTTTATTMSSGHLQSRTAPISIEMKTVTTTYPPISEADAKYISPTTPMFKDMPYRMPMAV